jgi:hypothetical protein
VSGGTLGDMLAEWIETVGKLVDFIGIAIGRFSAPR